MYLHFILHRMDDLLHNLTKLTRLPEAQLMPILQYFVPGTVRRGAMLLVPGSMSSTAWFIGSGSIKAFYQVEEKRRTRTDKKEEKLLREITNWIVPGGGFIADIRAFFHRVPSIYHIEALEPCRLYSLSHEHYLAIKESHSDVAFAFVENTLAMADLRVQMCNLRDAADRFAMFESRFPEMCGRLSVNIQASYLNIDPTTLSRLRGRKK